MVSPSGQTVMFSAQPAVGGAPVSSSGTVNAQGVAAATVSIPPGAYTVGLTFAGDQYYEPSSASTQTLYVYQPTQFVIWGGNPPIPIGQPANVTIGQDYLFWGAHWAKQVQGGDFQANSSFS